MISFEKKKNQHLQQTIVHRDIAMQEIIKSSVQLGILQDNCSEKA